MFELFLDCLFHFNNILLGNSNNNNNSIDFLKKYFNFNHCNEPIIDWNSFWALSADVNKVKLIDTIMKLTYFNGINQIKLNDTKKFVYYCVEYNFFDYLSILLKYFNKNNIAIANGINYEDSPLLLLLKKEHLTEEWLQLLFNICIQCKVCITDEAYKEAINLCQTNDTLKNNPNYQAIIETSYEKIKQFQE